MSEASKLVVDALLGKDTVTVFVAGRPYYVKSPTIKAITMAAGYLNSVESGNTIGEVISSIRSLEDACKALSVFINGDDSLADELSEGTLGEIVDGLKSAWALISIADFQELSVLARSAARLIAKPRP